jgi:hypothetical protein
MSSMKDFVKVYNKKTGKWQLQNYRGGPYFDQVKQIRPSNLHGNITGRGHPLPHSKKAIEAMDILEQNNIGDKILASLRKNQNGMGMGQETHSSIEQRIKKLVMGSGLQVY